MAKRSRCNLDSAHKLADLADGAVKSPAAFAKPVYLVVAKRSARKSTYSFLEVDAAAVAPGHEAPLARMLGPFRGAKPGMSFVAAHSKHGSRIVGVGGRQGDTIIYDPSTHEEFTGPDLCCPKQEPILISHGGKVYAISRRPKVHLDATLDFEPWFESLDFNEGIPCLDHDDCSFWTALPPPPFFPCFLYPEEFRNPPDISVASYAAVCSYILISLQQDKGTYAFHVVDKTWEKVSNERLPFVGQAVPLGGSLFAACSVRSSNAAAAASVFQISIMASSTPAVSPKLATSLLSIHEFPVASEEELSRPLLCPLVKGSFCSIRQAFRQNEESNCLVTTFHMDNIEAEDLLVAGQVKKHYRTSEFSVHSRCLNLNSTMPVVAALSM